MQLQGMRGLKEGLELITGLISRFWEDLHPQLDPEDELDPSARVNVLLDLCGLDSLLRPLRDTTCIHSSVFGTITYRDVESFRSGATISQDLQQSDVARIAGAFRDCDLVELNTVTQDAAEALVWARELDQALADHLAPGYLPDLTPLSTLLFKIHAVLESHLRERQPSLGAESSDESSEQIVQRSTPVSNSGILVTQISSRQDVQRELDRLCDYYDRYEPSSPVPLLLKRARRLVTASFVDIVRDLAPDALSQIQHVCGIESED
jgi:type VI secretion system protein ImpA